MQQKYIWHSFQDISSDSGDIPARGPFVFVPLKSAGTGSHGIYPSASTEFVSSDGKVMPKTNAVANNSETGEEQTKGEEGVATEETHDDEQGEEISSALSQTPQETYGMDLAPHYAQPSSLPVDGAPPLQVLNALDALNTEHLSNQLPQNISPMCSGPDCGEYSNFVVFFHALGALNNPISLVALPPKTLLTQPIPVDPNTPIIAPLPPNIVVLDPGDQIATVTIIDTDSPITFSFEETSISVLETDGFASLRVNASRPTESDMMNAFQIVFTNGSATGGAAEPADYFNTLVEYFDPNDGGNWKQVPPGTGIPLFTGFDYVDIRVVILDDAGNPVGEGDETFLVGLAINGDLSNPIEFATVTISDPEDPLTFFFENDNINVDESAGFATLRIKASKESDTDLTGIQLVFGAGAATGGTEEPADYLNTHIEYFDPTANGGVGDWITITLNQSIVLRAGETHVDVRIALIDDTNNPSREGDENFTANLVINGNVAEPVDQALITIQDPSDPITYSFDDPNVSVLESEGFAVLRVNASTSSLSTVNEAFKIGLTDGTATGGFLSFDYNNVTLEYFDPNLNLGNGSWVTLFTNEFVPLFAGYSHTDIRIAIYEDGDPEDDETFQVALIVNGSTVETAEVTILDNDGPIMFSFDNPNITVDESAGYAELRVNASRTTDTEYTINFVVLENGSATGGSDYVNGFIEYFDTAFGQWVMIGTNDNVKISEGSDFVDIRITILDDNDNPIREGDETFLVGLVINGNFSDPQEYATVTIQDPSDPPPIQSLENAILINEIGLSASTEQDLDYGFHLDGGLSYIELFNSTENSFSGDYIEQMRVQVARPDGTVFTIDLSTMSGDVAAHGLGAHQFLVLYSDGTWAIHNADGSIAGAEAFGSYTTAAWDLGTTTGEQLGVNLIQQANAGFPNQQTFFLDTFLANGINQSLLTNADAGWLGAFGATERNITNQSQLDNELNAQFNGILSDQDSILAYYGLTRPSPITGQVVYNPISASTMVFARVFAPTIDGVALGDLNGGVPIPMDTNTEADWTIMSTGSQGALNDVSDPNAQSGGGDYNPAQGTGLNPDGTTKTATAGQTVIDDQYDGVNNDHNTFYGGFANDFLYGDLGNDTIYGGENNDYIFGNQGNDKLFGNNGVDFLIDFNGESLLVGGSGDDVILTSDFALTGANLSTGNDLIIGDNIIQLALPGDSLATGSDVIIASQGSGEVTHDIIFGDNFSIFDGDIDGFLSNPYQYVVDRVLNNFQLIQSLSQEGGDDYIHGGYGNDIIFGQGGNDVIYGGHGNDTIYAGAGDDVIFGGLGDDAIYVGGWDESNNIIADNSVDGRDIIRYNPEDLGLDMIYGFYTDVNGPNGSDVIDLDAIFDFLGTPTENRVGAVNTFVSFGDDFVGFSLHINGFETENFQISFANPSEIVGNLVIGTDINTSNVYVGTL